MERISPSCIALGLLICLCGQKSLAQGQAKLTEANQLETLVFDQQLSNEEARRRIAELFDPRTRPEAFQTLSDKGAGLQSLLCEIAAETEDLDTSVALADLVYILDLRYRDTDAGRRLAILYQHRGELLLPGAWKAWRENTLDLRAVAQIMALDPETVWAWLGTTGDRRDRARYLLLRLRESSRSGVLKDTFVRQHLFEQPASTLAFVMRDVFPMPLHHPRGFEHKIDVCGGKRLVGRIVLNAVAVEGVRAKSGTSRVIGNRAVPQQAVLELPALDKIYVYPRIEFTHVWLAQRSRNFAWHVRLNTTLLMRPGEGQAPEVFPMISDVAYSQRPAGLAPLPLVELTEEQAKWLQARRGQIPEWMRAYIAERYHSALRFIPDEENLGAPERIEPMPPPEQFVMPKGSTGSPTPIQPLAKDAVGLLVLPPRITTGPGGGEDEILAQLALDRLAEEIAGEHLAQIVDRRQLDALLAEKSLAQESVQALTGYDILLRLYVDASQLRPQATFNWVHSSTGGLLASRETAWPLTEAEVPDLIAGTRTALKAVGQLDQKLPRVRLLGSASRIGQSRTAPLSRRLLQAFETSLLASKKVLVMQHLEAGSAQEESLLQLMGLSRLPGGRTFSPAADVSLEIDLQEQEGVGKSFEQTPLALTVRLIRTKEDDIQKFELTGLVNEFDALMVNAWEQVAAEIEFAPRAAATEWLNSEADRRRQAEAEMTALQNNPGGAMQQLARVDAALTIDPTYEPARIKALRIMRALFDSRDPIDPGLPLRAVRDAAELLRHYKANGREAGKDVAYPDYKLPMEAAVAAIRYAEQQEHAVDTHNSQRLTDHAAMIASLQEMVNLYLPSGSWVKDNYTRYAVSTVYQGLETHGVSLRERRNWLDLVLAACDEYPYPPQAVKLMAYTELFWVDAAHLALEEQDYERAVALTEKIREHAAEKLAAGDDLKPQLHFLLTSLDDADLFPAYASLFGVKLELELPAIRWPSTPITWGPTPEVSYQRIESPDPLQPTRNRAMAALTATEDRLYVLISTSLDSISWKDLEGYAPILRTARIGWLPLDAAGRPVGRAVPLPQDRNKTVWNELQLLPELERGFGLPLAAAVLDDSLFVISRDGGLARFDAEKQSWTRYGAEQGLPANSFYSLLKLDDRRLLLAGKDENHQLVYFTLDVQSNQPVLLRRERDAGQRQIRQLQPVGNDWNCWTTTGLWQALFTPQAKFIPVAPEPRYGWRESTNAQSRNVIQSALELAGRQFLISDSGMYEVDEEAKVVRAWFSEQRILEQSPVADLYSRTLILPGNSPLRDERAVRCGRTIVFAKGGLLLYAPDSDTWYGPVEVPNSSHVYASGANLWFATSAGLVHVDPRNVVAAAEKAERVYSTAEYRQRLTAACNLLPAVEQGKLLYTQREFEQAIGYFEKALEEDAHDAEAQDLLGDAQVQMKRYEDALAAYDRMAQHSDPKWAAQGLFKAAVILHHQQKWDELRQRLDQIDKQYPRMGYHRRTVLNKYRAALEKAGES